MLLTFLLALTTSVLWGGHHHLVAADSQNVELEGAGNGTLPVNPQIAGGGPSPRGAFPFFVQGYGCGATLIWYDIVLTAAHCYDELNVPPHKGVIVGGTKRDRTSGGAERRWVIEQVPHPSFILSSNPFHIAWDFMVAKLDQPVTKPRLQPIALNMDSKLPKANKQVQAVGFGTLSNGGPFPKQLQNVTLESLSHNKCKRVYQSLLNDTVMLCAQDPKDKMGVCGGDSGGPLLWSDTQVGIVSFQKNARCGKFPGVFSRVSAAANWIQEQVCWFSSQPPQYCFENDYFPVNKTRVDFQYFQNAFQISWQLKDVLKETILMSYDYFRAQSPYARIIEYVDLEPNTTYALNIFDLFGEGMPGGFANFTFIKNITERISIANITFNFTNSESVVFTTPDFEAF